jgi:polyhydroxyalkanoate synthase
MNTWVSDLVPLAGGAFRQLIRELYRDNRLIKGTMVLRGERVDVANIRASLLNIIATEDHIVPPIETETVMDLVGSQDKQLLKIPGGHIGMMAGSQAIKRTWPPLEAWLAERSGEKGAGVAQ